MTQTIAYMATYVVQNKIIIGSNAPTSPLSDCTTNQTYICLKYGLDVVYLDLTQMLLKEPRINLTTPVMTYLDAILTDLVVAGYSSSAFPVIDPETGGYDNRLNAYDALAASDLQIDYTSLLDPTVRNDPYQRATLNDLIFSSKTRDFSNCLVTVNGVFHPTVLFEDQLIVLRGFHNIKNNEPNGKKIGIYDTTSLGGHTVVPLALNQVVNTPSQDPTKGIYLSFPGVNFTGKTVLLSFGGYLYALDDAYEIVGTSRIKIDINKMDLINQFMHNPNTVYEDQYGSLAFNIKRFGNDSIDNPDPVPHPSVQQEILYFLNTQYPALTAAQTGPTPAMLSSYSYSDLYSFVRDIRRFLKVSELTEASFIYKILSDPGSFLILINNPNIYVRKYPLLPEFDPAVYQVVSKDMPRGLLRYNHNKTFPYVILSGSTDNRHIVSIDYIQQFKDLYKTAFGEVPTIPSPWFDGTSYKERFPVELMELYAA